MVKSDLNTDWFQAASILPGSSMEQSKDQKIRHALATLKQRINSTNLQLEQCRNEQEVVTSEIYSFREAEDRLKQFEAGPNTLPQKGMIDHKFVKFFEVLNRKELTKCQYLSINKKYLTQYKFQ